MARSHTNAQTEPKVGKKQHKLIDGRERMPQVKMVTDRFPGDVVLEPCHRRGRPGKHEDRRHLPDVARTDLASDIMLCFGVLYQRHRHHTSTIWRGAS